MLFNSYLFILLFLPLTLAGYFIIHSFFSSFAAKLFLFGMSLWFYGYFNIKYLSIILFSIVVNFGLNKWLLDSSNIRLRKILVSFGLAFDIGILVFFKYSNFFIENVNTLFKLSLPTLSLLLPLGISFFTFQQISFILDGYHRLCPSYEFLDYALFITFFPHLLAGPIVLHDDIIPQFNDADSGKINFENLSKGLAYFALGLAKKVLVADTFGRVVNTGYNTLDWLTSADAWIVAISYTLQIYFDFSGYCEMAIGLGLMLNIRMPVNFNSPYKSLTIVEFWKRWHITLSRFFTRYVYIPLGGNRKGTARTYLNSFVVFFISGFWHGANWTFIIWGIIHGTAMILTKYFDKRISKVPKFILWFITFSFVNLTWVFFRSPSVAAAFDMMAKMFTLKELIPSSNILNEFNSPELAILFEKIPVLSNYYSILIALGWILIVMIFVVAARNTQEKIEHIHPNARWALSISVLMTWAIVSLSNVSTFIYFNF